MDWGWLDWPAVLLLGGVVGASELISRYKDDPWAAIRSWPAIAYIAINSAAAAGALGLMKPNHWFEKAFFRTSLFVVRAGDRDVGVGPSGFLQIFLTATDRDVDRQRAATRSAVVADAMKGIDFTKAMKALPPLCLALMQNVSAEDQQKLRRTLKDLEEGVAEPSVKTMLLGLELINVVGADVLTTAVKSLGDQIRSLPEV